MNTLDRALHPIRHGDQQTEVAFNELQLGDRVRLPGGDAYNDATVIKVAESEVTLFRPYVTTSDFLYTGGIIPYIGVSQFTVPRDDWRGVTLLHRVKPGKIR